MPYDKYVIVDLDYEPVISQKLWDKAQKILDRNSKQLRKNSNLKKIYLLSGLLKFEDMSPFHGTSATNGTGKPKLYYYNKKHKCRLDAAEVEKGAPRAVIQLIKDSDKLFKAIKRYSQSNSRKALLKHETERLEQKVLDLEALKLKAQKRLDFCKLKF